MTPTGLDAERLADDLTCLLASRRTGRRPRTTCGALAGPVTVLPAWETLPFERVSPEIETMGRRLAVLHALTASRDAGLRRRPGSSSPRCGRCCSGSGPSRRPPPMVIVRGQQVDVASPCCTSSSRTGYRREHQVEHRGEFAVRGGIVDVFPSTADVPGAHRPVG